MASRSFLQRARRGRSTLRIVIGLLIALGVLGWMGRVITTGWTVSGLGGLGLRVFLGLAVLEGRSWARWSMVALSAAGAALGIHMLVGQTGMTRQGITAIVLGSVMAALFARGPGVPEFFAVMAERRARGLQGLGDDGEAMPSGG